MIISRFIKSSLLVTALVFVTGQSWCAESDNPLLGRWLVRRVGVRDATKLPFQIEWEFTKDKVIVRDVTNSQELSRNNYTIDLTKDPKWITVVVVDRVKEIRLGIFRIIGGELHLKQTVGEGDRPADFPKDGHSIMKRQTLKKSQPNGAANPNSAPLGSLASSFGMTSFLTIFACLTGLLAFGFGLGGILGLMSFQPPKHNSRRRMFLLNQILAGGLSSIIHDVLRNWSERQTERRFVFIGIGNAVLCIVLVALIRFTP